MLGLIRERKGATKEIAVASELRPNCYYCIILLICYKGIVLRLAKRHFTSTVVAIAGCAPVTFRAWRNRNGLFPSTKEAEGWNTFSNADIAAVRAVVVLTGLGLEANTAVQVAMACLPEFERMFLASAKGKLSEKIVAREIRDMAIVRSPPEGDRTGDFSNRISFISSFDPHHSWMQAGGTGTAITLNLTTVMRHVVDELLSGDYQSLATPAETLRIVATSLANAFEPKNKRGNKKR